MSANPYLMSMVADMPPVLDASEEFGFEMNGQNRRAGRMAKLGQRAQILKMRIYAAKQAGRNTGMMERRLNSLMRRLNRVQHRQAGSSNAGESGYLFDQYVHMEDDAGMLPGYDPYSEGALSGIPEDDEDLIGDLDPELLDDVEGSMALNPQWAQLMHEADYGPEGYSDVAMSYMSPVEQVDDLFSPYIIERSGIADFDMDEVDDMMGDDDLYGMDFENEFGGGGRIRARRAARKELRQDRRSARKSRRADRRSSRKSFRARRKAIRQNQFAKRRGPGQSSTRPVSVTSQQDAPMPKSSPATLTTQAIPSKRAAGNHGLPGPARNYKQAIRSYEMNPSAAGLDRLNRIWANPQWKRAPTRRRLPSPEAVSEKYAQGSSNFHY